MSESESNKVAKKSVVRKGHDRRLSGFEESKSSKSWNEPFFFVQAADTQLGLIQVWGDGTIW